MVTSVANFYSAHNALLAGFAAAFFVICWLLIAILSPIIIASLPADYFANPTYLEAGELFAEDIPFVRRLLLLLKNVGAWLLILVGPFAFQSVLAPFFGLLLADFPAKPKLIRRFASNRFIWRLLNGLRRRTKKPLFDAPQV